MKQLSIFILATVLSSCESDEDIKKDLSTNEGMRAKWEQGKPDSYEYTASRICYCDPQFTGSFRIRIIDGALDTAFYEDFENWELIYVEVDTAYLAGLAMEEAETLSIEAVFDKIDESLKSNPVSDTIAYHPEYFFPSYFFFDYNENIADEEFGISIRNFTIL